MRKQTEKLLTMIEEGLLDPSEVVTMCVNYMSEDDVADMMDCNELSDRFTDGWEEDEGFETEYVLPSGKVIKWDRDVVKALNGIE